MLDSETYLVVYNLNTLSQYLISFDAFSAL